MEEHNLAPLAELDRQAKLQRYGRKAPLIRNDEIVNIGEVLVALWDGRTSGGTYYTIRKAKNLQKKIILLKDRTDFRV